MCVGFTSVSPGFAFAHAPLVLGVVVVQLVVAGVPAAGGGGDHGSGLGVGHPRRRVVPRTCWRERERGKMGMAAACVSQR